MCLGDVHSANFDSDVMSDTGARLGPHLYDVCFDYQYELCLLNPIVWCLDNLVRKSVWVPR